MSSRRHSARPPCPNRPLIRLSWLRMFSFVLSLCAKLRSRVQLSVTLWTIAHQAPLSMQFSKQEYWSGLPFPPPGELLHPGTETVTPALAGGFFTLEPPGSPQGAGRARCAGLGQGPPPLPLLPLEQVLLFFTSGLHYPGCPTEAPAHSVLNVASKEERPLLPTRGSSWLPAVTNTRAYLLMREDYNQLSKCQQ